MQKEKWSSVSHAQFGEDLVLWGALNDVEKGFYIDVGAAHPSDDSVTKLFYEKGWSGINVEPRPGAFRALANERQRDINLQVAISNYSGSMTLHELDDFPGLSTSVSQYADDYAGKGMRRTTYRVDCRTLDDVCIDYVRSKNIHFLKIDVEGAERSVLEGFSFKRFRPWVLVVEATVPLTYTPSHEEWERLVLDAGYEFALFHQINRYYVAREKSFLKSRVVPPPDMTLARDKPT